MNNARRDAAKLEAAALYESEDTYNYPEEAMEKAFERGATWQAAQSQPAPPVPQTVQEIMRLMIPYVAACVSFNHTPRERIEAAGAEINATFKPLLAALTALVEKNHELQFSLDGVNAMRRPLTEADSNMADEYQRWIDFYHAGNGDYAEFLRGIEPEQEPTS